MIYKKISQEPDLSRPSSSTLNTSRRNPGRREKNQLNFYFYASLWCLKRFYEGPEGLRAFMKPFVTPQRSVKIKI